MQLRHFILSSFVVAVCGITVHAQQSWSRPGQLPGVETQQDEQGHRTRALHDFVGQTQSPPPAPLVSNWQALGPFGGDIDDVQVSPINANIVLAGLSPASSSGGGVYRSTDGGVTWATVATLDGKLVHDLAFAPDGTAYAGTIDGVWKSTNSGASFVNLPLGIGLNDEVFEIDVDPSNPLRLWIGIGDANGNQPVNVMLSVDGGTIWTNKTPPLAAPQSCSTIAIDPNNSLEVYAGFRGFPGGGQVWVSTNGGTSWINRSAGLPNRPVNDIVHDGTRALVGGGQLFGGQTFGLFSSPDDGVTWTPLHNGSWTNLVVQDIAVDPNNVNTIYAATAGNGLYRSTDGGTVWSFGVGGTSSLSVNAVSFAPGSSSTIFTGSSSNAVWRSTNSGASFGPSSTGIGALDVFSIAVNPLNSNELAIAFQGLNDGGVHTSTNGGATWTLAALPGTRYNNVRFSPAGVLYAISDGPTTIGAEALYRRTGSTWTSIGPDQGPVFESELFGMRVSANNPNFIVAVGADFGVAGAEATVWRTTNGGGLWTKVYEGAASKPFQDVLVVDPATDAEWLACHVDYTGGQQGGVFRSSDFGVTFAPSNNGLPALMSAFSLASTTLGGGAIYVSNSQAVGANAVFKTVDGGQNWSPTGFLGQALEVATDGFDPNVLYIAQFGAVRVSASTDGGATFTPFSTGLSTNEYPRDLQRSTTGGKLFLAATKGSYSTDVIPPYASFCSGDGSGTACPCANSGIAGNGCANSTFAIGAQLTGSGSAGASSGTDTFVLTASNIGGPGLFFQGTSTTGGGVLFGDGLLCLGGALVRVGVVFPTGSSASYPGGTTPNPIHIAGAPIAAGDVRHYQCWYRDALVFCSPSTFNLTQGLTAVWGP